MKCTKLSFKDLVKKFNDPDLEREWKLLHLKEMENILLEGGPEAKKTEAFLRGLLDSKDPGYKSIAFRYLVTFECMDEETGNKLKFFLEELDNKEIFEKGGEPAI